MVCEALDLERSGKVVDLAERIMQFCRNPKDSGKKPPSKPKKKSKGGSRKSAPE